MPTKGKKEKGRGGNLPFVVKRTNEAALGTVHSDRARQCTHTHCSGASHPLRGRGSAVVSRRWWHALPLEFNLGNLGEGTLWLVLAPRK